MGEGNSGEKAPVLIRTRDGSEWHQPAESSYPDEATLRDILAAQPALIPGVGDEAVAVTEFQVPSVGPVDVLTVGRDGSITLVECKLASNADIRRTVVGQALGYASGTWQMDVQEFSGRFRRRHPADISPVTALLGVGADPADIEELTDRIGANLDSGRFGIILAVDTITAELRRTVEYLNAHTVSDVTIAALEMAYVADHGVELLLPTVYGLELADQKRAAARPRNTSQWTEAELFAALAASLDAAGLAAARVLYDHFRDRALRYYFGTGKSPSVTAVFATDHGHIQPWSIWTSPPSVSLNFEYMRRADHGARERLLARLESEPLIAPALESVSSSDFEKRPGIKVAGILDQPGVMGTVIDALDEFLATT